MFDIFVVIPDCRDVPMSSRVRLQLVTHYRVEAAGNSSNERKRGFEAGGGGLGQQSS